MLLAFAHLEYLQNEELYASSGRFDRRDHRCVVCASRTSSDAELELFVDTRGKKGKGVRFRFF